MQTTGPKISSCATRHALSTSASTAGRMKYPSPSSALAAGDVAGALVDADREVVERGLPLTRPRSSGPICVESSSGLADHQRLGRGRRIAPRIRRRRRAARTDANARSSPGPRCRRPTTATVSIAASRSASSNTTLADLPPSSSETRVMFVAAVCITVVPTSVDPVNEIFATLGSAISAVAVVEPGPGTTLSAPSGRPASYRMSAIASAVSGVCDAGLTTAVFPQASAGAIFQLAITAGKFHGVIRAQTPTGSRSVTSRPGARSGSSRP